MIHEKEMDVVRSQWLYGKIILEEARRRNLTPILAGPNRTVIEQLVKANNLPFKVFSLKNQQEIQDNLSDIDIVSLCAGPFSATSKSMVDACIATRTHYVDITGEIDVFVNAHSHSEKATAAGIVVCPGVGFEVIPTDCVASSLKEAMPDATHLALGFDSRSGFSPGTAKTSVEGLKLGNQIRKDGIIIPVSLAYK